MNAELVQRIRDCSALPSLPTIALKVLELARQDDSDVAEIARVITKDAALSSKILRTVNSSFYGRSQKVGTISHAMVILGLQSVKTLVLGFSLVTSLSRNRSKSDRGGSFDHVRYWKRSIYAATAARTIATKLPQANVQGEECFLAGLLMDIGMLVLDQTLGAKYAALVEKAATHQGLSRVEAVELGMTHAEVSRVLAEHWKLPPVLSQPMACHHYDQTQVGSIDASVRPLADVVRLASRCADVFMEADAAAPIKDVRAACQAGFEMSGADADLMLDEISRRTAESAPLFDIKIGNESYDAILKKANERLIELTLSTQRQAAELQASASTLQAQNAQLKAKALTDALTGLGNRAGFDATLAQQLAMAKSSQKSLALLLLDVDHFKAVNDTHGHPTGDAVLRSIAQVLKAAAMSGGGSSFRYGGEELALIIPGAARARAAALAETIRAALAARPVVFGQTSVKVTASIGVVVFEPGGALSEPAHLLKAADLAVYAAKKAGRNFVKVFSLNKSAA
jgi:diguanylate cyclase (GGDEF)-like protein